MRKKKKFNKNNIVATEANDEDDKQNNIGNYYDYDYDKPKSK